MGDFADSMKQGVGEILADINTDILKISSELFTDVVKFSPSDYQPDGRSSPYADGYLVNSWYVGVNRISEEVSSVPNMLGKDSLNRIEYLSRLKTFIGKDGYVSFTNRVPYIEQAEVKGWKTSEWIGWNNAAPYAMAEKALIKMVGKT